MTDTPKQFYSVDINRTVMKDGKPYKVMPTRIEALSEAVRLNAQNEKSEGK